MTFPARGGRFPLTPNLAAREAPRHTQANPRARNLPGALEVRSRAGIFEETWSPRRNSAGATVGRVQTFGHAATITALSSPNRANRCTTATPLPARVVRDFDVPACRADGTQARLTAVYIRLTFCSSRARAMLVLSADSAGEGFLFICRLATPRQRAKPSPQVIARPPPHTGARNDARFGVETTFCVRAMATDA